jgi:hypothetical protein
MELDCPSRDCGTGVPPVIRKYTWGLDLAGQMGSVGAWPANLESAGGIAGLLAMQAPGAGPAEWTKGRTLQATGRGFGRTPAFPANPRSTPPNSPFALPPAQRARIVDMCRPHTPLHASELLKADGRRLPAQD